MFNQTVSFKGFIKATNSAGTKNMALVETSIVLPRTCAPNNALGELPVIFNVAPR